LPSGLNQDRALAQQGGIAFGLVDREEALPRDFGWINSLQHFALLGLSSACGGAG
jgi:hypothetical protein